MKLELSLVIICIFLSKASTLRCYERFPPYDETVVTCADSCSGYTAFATTEDETIQSSNRMCGSPVTCTTSSLNLGFYRESINARCCKTDLCNTYELPVLTQKPNGKKCYFCNGDDCSGTISCAGIENHCITLTDVYNVTVKGCTSVSLCENPPNLRLQQQSSKNWQTVTCCTGNLCNTAEELRLSLILISVPILLTSLLR